MNFVEAEMKNNLNNSRNDNDGKKSEKLFLKKFIFTVLLIAIFFTFLHITFFCVFIPFKPTLHKLFFSI